MEARLHRVEVELPLARDDDLAVERGVGWKQLADLAQLREVPQQRAAVSRPESELAAVVLEDAAEAVPLRLLPPGALRGHLGDELGLHRREGNVRAWRIGHGRASLSAMRFLAAGLLVVALAGCGGGGSSSTNEEPQIAHLATIDVSGDTLKFAFDNAPSEVRGRYVPKTQLAECGSGMDVPLKGSAFYVVHFVPAASAKIEGEKVVKTYKGPYRLSGPGPILELARTCDFESDLAWAVGLERRLQPHVSQDGSTVTVTFG